MTEKEKLFNQIAAVITTKRIANPSRLFAAIEGGDPFALRPVLIEAMNKKLIKNYNNWYELTPKGIEFVDEVRKKQA